MTEIVVKCVGMGLDKQETMFVYNVNGKLLCFNWASGFVVLLTDRDRWERDEKEREGERWVGRRYVRSHTYWLLGHVIRVFVFLFSPLFCVIF